eukprot:1177089-Prorocentrum_minimum.AAC.1
MTAAFALSCKLNTAQAVGHPTVLPNSRARLIGSKCATLRPKCPTRSYGGSLRRTTLMVRGMASEEGKESNSEEGNVSKSEVSKTSEGDSTSSSSKSSQKEKNFGGANLFDPAATISRAVTKRFGLVGGLGFVGN